MVTIRCKRRNGRASEINTERKGRKRGTLTIFLATEKIIVLLMLGTMITIQTRGKGDARAQRLIVLSAAVIACIVLARTKTLSSSRQSNRTDSANICFDTTHAILYRRKTIEVGRVQLTLLKAIVVLLEFVARIDRGTRARPEDASMPASTMYSPSICHQRETRINMLIFLPHTGAQQTTLGSRVRATDRECVRVRETVYRRCSKTTPRQRLTMHC